MEVTYDKEADAMYISVRKGKVHRTHEVSDSCVVDVDKKGALLGVELLFVSHQLPKQAIAKTIRKGIPVAVAT